MKRRSIALATGALALALAFVAACPAELPPPTPCGVIPEGGCPRGGDVCADPACASVYFCQSSGTWRLDRTCPAREGGVPEAAPIVDASRDASIDVDVPGAFGGPGCESLDTPDCALGVALACADCCGCEDVFVCENGGWTLYGACVNGTITRDSRD
jgi:hypothetical protein